MPAPQALNRTPSVYVRESRACPRCDSPHFADLPAVASESTFDWHECRECSYLWAMPRALTMQAVTAGCR
jgi:hypothetical protein